MAHKQNYTAQAQLSRQNKLASGLLLERFPSVSTIVIRMTYFQRGANPVLMLRTVNILPSDAAFFKMECVIKGCDGGGFDLTQVIVGMVKAHKKVAKGKLSCCGKIDSQALDHASIEYEVGIRYGKKSK
jgi:hypothetical protein